MKTSMKTLLMAATVVAVGGLAACEKKEDAAEVPAAESELPVADIQLNQPQESGVAIIEETTTITPEGETVTTDTLAVEDPATGTTDVVVEETVEGETAPAEEAPAATENFDDFTTEEGAAPAEAPVTEEPAADTTETPDTAEPADVPADETATDPAAPAQ